MKKIVFSVILIVGLYLFVELISFSIYGITRQSLFSWGKLQAQRTKIVDDYESILGQGKRSKKVREKKGPREEIIHPYLGYVVFYRDSECSGYGFCDERMKKYPTAPITAKTDDNVIVGIFGGSFAAGVSLNTPIDYFADKFKEIEAFKDKKIVIHTIALGGYKQPQQLMALNYYLSLGAHFDYVINIDGFNEVVLPITDNLGKGTNPFFPRLWSGRVRRGSQDKVLMAIVGEVSYFKRKQSQLAHDLNRSFLRHSVFVNVLWSFVDQYLEGRGVAAEQNITRHRKGGTAFGHLEVAGPPYTLPRKDIVEDLARKWENSSRQMSYLCDGNGIKYYHFLQPNQYVDDSKPMSDEEKKIAIVNHHPYKSHAEKGYPFLIEAGKRLVKNGVPFHDLTMMFVDNDDVLYKDGCCHLNTKGYELVIDRIVDTIRADL